MPKADATELAPKKSAAKLLRRGHIRAGGVLISPVASAPHTAAFTNPTGPVLGF